MVFLYRNRGIPVGIPLFLYRNTILINSWPSIAIASDTSLTAREAEGTLTPQKSLAVISLLP